MRSKIKRPPVSFTQCDAGNLSNLVKTDKEKEL
jgi:hypothetical protein